MPPTNLIRTQSDTRHDHPARLSSVPSFMDDVSSRPLAVAARMLRICGRDEPRVERQRVLID